MDYTKTTWTNGSGEPIDADNLNNIEEGIEDAKEELAAIAEIRVDTNEPSGFVREDNTTMGVMEFSPDGVTVHKIDYDGTYSSSTPATYFGDGTTALAARKFIIYPYSTNDLDVYIEGTKNTITTTKEITIDDTDGMYYIYFQASGVLAQNTTFSFDYFEEQPICALVAWDATNNLPVLFADERHGVSMDGMTHRYLHFTQAAQYVSGMELNGLSSGGTTHGAVDSGVAYDEDIYLQLSTQSTLPFWYKVGSAWRSITADNLLGHTQGGDSYISYNNDTGGVFSLDELAQANDCAIYFIMATNNRINPYVKLIGQNSYSNAGAARDAISTELADIVLAGLPTPEFIFIAAYIVDGDGELKLLADGSTHLDLRETSVSGTGGAAGVSTNHYDLLNIGENTHAEIDTHMETTIVDADFTSEGVMYRGSSSGTYSIKTIGVDIQAYNAGIPFKNVGENVSGVWNFTNGLDIDHFITINDNYGGSGDAGGLTTLSQLQGTMTMTVKDRDSFGIGWDATGIFDFYADGRIIAQQLDKEDITADKCLITKEYLDAYTALVDGDFTSEGVMYRGATTGTYSIKTIGTDIQAYDADTAKTDATQAWTAPQRSTAVTEDASIAFNSGNNIKFSMTGDSALTVVNQTVDQSGVIVITGADHITGYPTEFDFGVQGAPTSFAVDDVATFAYYISGASGADSIKIGVL